MSKTIKKIKLDDNIYEIYSPIPKFTKDDAGKILLIDEDGTLKWVTLS